MMGQILLFWRVYPPDPNIDYIRWTGFCEAMAGWMVMGVLLATALIIGCYWLHAQRKKIRQPEDVFAPYTPMRWLWLACLPSIALFGIYANEYEKLFRNATMPFMTGAVGVGLEAGFLTFILAYLLMWIPGITPAKYRYRPRWLIYRWQRWERGAD
jgi:hypothetical protein